MSFRVRMVRRARANQEAGRRTTVLLNGKDVSAFFVSAVAIPGSMIRAGRPYFLRVQGSGSPGIAIEGTPQDQIDAAVERMLESEGLS